MNRIALLLKLSAPIFLIVGALHLVLGLQADVLLGAKLPIDVIKDPALDSQNRFYGVAFTLYGVLLFLCAGDLKKYITVLHCILWVFFLAGAARLVSIALYGVPPVFICLLLATELLIPPALIIYLARANNGS